MKLGSSGWIPFGYSACIELTEMLKASSQQVLTLQESFNKLSAGIIT